ncbi:MAG: gliding motility-associated C-terminal domain-containing protein, partial [Flavobacteriales bacterium]|nr:gliding motility-associated C-terminal domain-containing protein [Flavobacteriales bacterium]
NFGCGSASRSPVYLVVNALPQAPSGMGDTVCSGDTANLFATAPTGVTFDWYDNTSGGVLVNSGTQYQITPALSTDTFYLESVSNQNCKSAVRIPVYLVVNPLPAQPTALGDTVCVGDTATLLATSPSGVTFVWYASSTGGIALDSGFQFGIDSALINTTYWVEAINTTNCKNTNRTPVDLVVQPAPTNPQANGDLVCFGDVGTLTATAPNNVVFNWYADASGNNYLNSGINYDVIPAVVTDTFYLEAVSSIGCGSTALIPVIIQVSQLPSLTVINTNDLSCNGSADGVAEVLATGGAPNYVYQWGPTSNLQSGATATALNAGIHTVIVTDSLGCKDTLDVSLNEPQAIQANISPENAHCNEGGSATVTVSAGGTAPFNYLWSDPLSQTASTATGLTASSFSVTITDFNGCQTMQSVVIDDTSAVFAEIDADPLQGFNPITVDFTSLSTGAITDYLWEFADGNSSVEMDPSHTYDAYGDFMVHLTVSNGYCKDVDSILIKVNASSQIFIPNVFSPNGDGMNDKFMPEFIGIEEVNVRVFNRWGHLMTEWNNLEKGSWDGRMSSGNWASEGTYYYFIKARGFDGEIFEETGSLNLVK